MPNEEFPIIQTGQPIIKSVPGITREEAPTDVNTPVLHNSQAGLSSARRRFGGPALSGATDVQPIATTTPSTTRVHDTPQTTIVPDTPQTTIVPDTTTPNMAVNDAPEPTDITTPDIVEIDTPEPTDTTLHINPENHPYDSIQSN